MEIGLKTFQFETVCNEILGKNEVIGDGEDEQESHCFKQ